MTKKTIQVVLATGLAFALGCGGGTDETGCRPGAQRCDSNVIQVCVADARSRSFRWEDVEDCKKLACVETGEEQLIAGVECAWVDAGVPPASR